MPPTSTLLRNNDPAGFTRLQSKNNQIALVTSVQPTSDGGRLLNMRFQDGSYQNFYLDAVNTTPVTTGDLHQIGIQPHARQVQVTVSGVDPPAIYADGVGAHSTPVNRLPDTPQKQKGLTSYSQQRNQDMQSGVPITGPPYPVRPSQMGPPVPSLIQMGPGPTPAPPLSQEESQNIATLANGGFEAQQSPTSDPWNDVWLPPAVGMPQASSEINVPPGYLRIGYITLHVDSPIDAIQVRESTPFDSKQTIRSKTPIQKGNTHAAQVIDITLTFDTPANMNQTLLPLVRLFRRAPFLPVVNQLLQDQGITALALQSLQVATMPQFPNVLQATLTCWSFNWHCYLPQSESLDAQFCYPLLKLWAESPRDPSNKQTPVNAQGIQKNPVTQFQPLPFQWNGTFQLYHASEQWLETASEYPQAAAKAQSWNNDLLNLQSIPASGTTSNDAPTSFNTIQAGQDASNTGAIMGFDGTSSQLYVSGVPGYPPGNFIFITLKDPIMAAQLAESTQDFVVLKGTPQIEYNVQTSSIPAGDPGPTTTTVTYGWSLPSSQPYMTAANFLALIQGINSNTPGGPVGPHSREDELSVVAGRYTFVVPASNTALTALGQQDPKIPPSQPGTFGQENDHPFAPPSLIVETISASVENVLAPQQVRDQRVPTHQYIGSTSLVFNLTGTLSNASDVKSCADFFQQVNALARKYPGRWDGTPFGGMVKVDNELFQFMGVNRVLPWQWSVETVREFPGVLRFSLTLVEFDTTQQSRELLQALTANIQQQNADGNGINYAVTSTFDNFQTLYLRQAELKRRLRSAELYPDLCLPTHSTLQQWVNDLKSDHIWNWDTGEAYPNYSYLNPEQGGTSWQWTTDESLPDQGIIIGVIPTNILTQFTDPHYLDRFAEPDFYVAPSAAWGKGAVEAIVNSATGMSWELYDQYKVSTQIKSQVPLASSPITDPLGNYATQAKQGKVNSPLNTTPSGQAGASISPRASVVGPLDQALRGTPATTSPSYQPFGSPLQYSGTGLVPSSLGNINPSQFPNSVSAVSTKNPVTGFNAYKTTIVQAAQQAGIDPALLAAVLRQESGFNNNAVSNSGAKGLGQFIPATGQEIGKSIGIPNPNLTDPGTSIILSATYLKQLLTTFNGNSTEAIAAYNAGPGAVEKYGGVPPFPQTQNYVQKITQTYWPYYRGVLGTSGANLELTQQSQAMSQMFAKGYVYPSATLTPFLNNQLSSDPTTQKLPSSNPKGWINPDWLTSLTGSQQVNVPSFGYSLPYTITDPTSNSYYVVNPSSINDFVTAAAVNGFKTLPTALPPQTAGQLITASKQNYTYAQLTHADILTPPVTPQEAFYNPTTGMDMFHDLRREIIGGRLVGAFPTFYVALIDGGRPMRIWRLFDHIYGMMSVTSIQVHRTRKGPIETALVSFSNMFNHLNAQVYETSLIQQDDPRGIFNVEWLSRTFSSFFQINDQTINAWNQHLQSCAIKPGGRLHIRMGYGSEANHLPIVFNGVITEVPVQEGEITVVALSDGRELCNEMPPHMNVGTVPLVRFNSYLGTGRNPRELILEMLDPAGYSWLGGLGTNLQELPIQVGAAATGNKSSTLVPFLDPSYRNDYGIEHFGYPIRSFLSNSAGELGVNIYNPAYYKPVNTTPAFDNMLQTFFLWDWNHDSCLIGVQIANARPWDIFEVCRKAIPDYICYPLPVDFRSTLFYGKSWFPLYGNYKEALDSLPSTGDPNAAPEKYFERKTFQQFHLIHSSWNLIGNMVRADASQIYTQCQAVGTENGWIPGISDMGLEQSWLMQVDSDIYTEFQRTKIVESGLYTTLAMKAQEQLTLAKTIVAILGGAIGVGLVVLGGTIEVGSDGLATPAALALGSLGKVAVQGAGEVIFGGSVAYLVGALAQAFQSRRVLDHYAAMTLKDSIKDMYQGPLVIQGSGWIKPYDLLQFQDQLSGLNGPCEVKEVIHTLSVDTGFVSEVFPDACVCWMDFDGQDIYHWASMIGIQMLMQMTVIGLMGQMTRQAANSVAVAGIRHLRDWLADEIANNPGGKAIQELGDTEARALLASLTNDLEATVGGKPWYSPGALGTNLRVLGSNLMGGSGNYGRVSQLLETVSSETGPYSELWNVAPWLIRQKINIVSGLRNIVGFSTGTLQVVKSSAGSFAKKGLTGVGSGFTKLGKKFQLQIDEAQDAMATAEKAFPNIAQLSKMSGRQLSAAVSPADLPQAEAAVASWLKAAKVIPLAKNGLVASSKGTAVAAALEKLGPAAAEWLGTAVGKTVSRGAVMGIIMGLCDGLAQMIDRWAVARQCLIIWPLRYHDKEWTAGIYGHRGAVVGDQMSEFDQVVTTFMGLADNHWWAGCIPVISSLTAADLHYEHKDITTALRAQLNTLENQSKLNVPGG